MSEPAVDAPDVAARAAERARRLGFALSSEPGVAGRRFADFTLHEYRHPVVYDARAYVDLLGTHSDHRMLAADDRDRLLGRIESLIDAAGSITVDYCTTLTLARRV